MLCFNMLRGRHRLSQRSFVDPSIYLCIYLSPPNALKQHADPVTLQAVTWRHKLHVNQSRVCPEVVRYAISKTALQPFVNVICLIAPYQYTDETCSLAAVRRERSGHIYFNTRILLWLLISFYCSMSTDEATLEG